MSVGSPMNAAKYLSLLCGLPRAEAGGTDLRQRIFQILWKYGVYFVVHLTHISTI